MFVFASLHRPLTEDGWPYLKSHQTTADARWRAKVGRGLWPSRGCDCPSRSRMAAPSRFGPRLTEDGSPYLKSHETTSDGRWRAKVGRGLRPSRGCDCPSPLRSRFTIAIALHHCDCPSPSRMTSRAASNHGSPGTVRLTSAQTVYETPLASLAAHGVFTVIRGDVGQREL